MRNAALTLTFFLSLGSTATAHPAGHEGGIGEVLTHAMSHPYHLVMIPAGLLAAVGIFALTRRSSSKRS